jgi:di/tricarboxylate transporter
MTSDIALVLVIIGVAVILFVSERLRVDLVALMVLGTLVLTGLVTTTEALSGFSNPAVITVWAMFILSGGLTNSGVANILGKQVMRLAGNQQFRLMVLIMLTAAVLSAFMNNVGVAALLLPVVMEIARRTGQPPSKLLIPLAFGALLGGLTTLIGTPPNILASDALRDAGMEPFGLFDFAPVGIVVMLAGIAFIALIGRHLLPNRDPAKGLSKASAEDLDEFYRIEDQMVMLRIPDGSQLAGMTLAESQLGRILGLNVVAIVHNGQYQFSPLPSHSLYEGDKLFAIGSIENLEELKQHQVETIDRFPLTIDHIEAAGIELAEVTLTAKSDMIGKTLYDIALRGNFGLNVISIRRGQELIRDNLNATVLVKGDILLIQGTASSIQKLKESNELQISEIESTDLARLKEKLLLVHIPEHSTLVGKTLNDSQLGAAYGLTVLRIMREDEALVLPESSDKILAGDTLLVQSLEEKIAAIRGLEELELDKDISKSPLLESEQMSLIEVVLSPHTTLVGKTLRELHFRAKYGLSVLAIWRAGEAYQEDLANMALRFGDALLLFGPRENIEVLSSEPDFLVLTEDLQPAVNKKKAPIAVAIMAAVFITVLIGWLPIAAAAVIGGTLMVLTKVLSMEDAYRYIEWPAVFLIAAMLPLGIAMQNSGAADYVSNGMLSIIGDFGPTAVLAGIFILSILASQVMPNAAVVVLMAPIAIATANDMDISVLTLMMGVAIAASASFLSPVSHPANILIMGPGGYRFSDYIKIGLPLTILILVIVVLILPIVWPF